MRCLVLGGSGFLGSHLIEALRETGHFVRCLDRNGAIQSAYSIPRHDAGQIEVVSGNFNSQRDLTQALDGIDVCYHLASTTIASTSNDNPSYDVESNLVGTIKLLDVAVKSGLKKLIFTSSGGTVYGAPKYVPMTEEHPTNPMSSYGITKLAIEKYLHLYNDLHGLESVVLRIANPYGERQRLSAKQGAVAVFLGHALQDEEIQIWGDGSIIRDYLHVSDVTDALLKSIDDIEGTKRLFNIGSGTGHSVNEILDVVECVTGKRTKRVYLPSRVFDVPVNVLDISAARDALGWRPKVTLDDGVRRFANWVANGNFG